MLDLSRFPGRVIATRRIAARDAIYAPIPNACHPVLRAALQQRGIDRLYAHQADAFESARGGENLVLTTGTASGKSLAYLLPILQTVLEDPAARALLLFPTKALAQDQLRGVLGMIDHLAVRADRETPRIEAGVYDGDTPPAERSRIRDRAHLVLTNPDMLHAALLPNHGRRGYAHLFRNVRYVVIDELHTYRGAFGAHVANLLRRLLRVCGHYGSAPRFLCTSATIANARDHAETVCRRPFRLIERDGSPSAGKIVHFWQPPLGDKDVRRPVTTELAQLVPYLVEKRRRTIAFCRSRKELEIVLKESRDRLRNVAGHDESYLLAGYRGGYTPEERRKVEKGLAGDKLIGVVSTSALELGIDVGSLQVVVQGGFPGTRASFWQQLGRAGRRGEIAYAIVVLAVSPIDQFIADDPDWLVGQPAEHAVLDPDNLAVELAHVRAAAAELPLSLDDAAVFPDLGEIVGVLSRAGEVREMFGSWHWTGSPFPAGEFGLRNVHGDRFKIVNRDTGTTLTEMTRPQAYREVHPRAVYLHDGTQYQVETLDLVQHVAAVTEVEQNFYTQPDVRTAIDVILAQERQAVGCTEAVFGDVRVDDAVVGYKMLEFHNHQNLGYERLHETLRLKVDTEAVWVTVPQPVLAVLARDQDDGLAGVVHAFSACARMLTMAERSDLCGATFRHTEETTGETLTALACYDAHPGGMGYAYKAYENIGRVLAAATALVEKCRCRSGCPACVGAYGRDPRRAAWALRRLLENVAPAADRTLEPCPDNDRGLRVPWLQVVERWSEVVTHLRSRRIAGAELLATLGPEAVERQGRRLVLRLASPGLVEWLSSEAARRRLWDGLRSAVDAPEDGDLVFEITARDRSLRAVGAAIKLQRRYDDLVAGRPATESEANRKLAEGYLLPSANTRTPEDA